MTDFAARRLPRALLAAVFFGVFLVLLVLVRMEWQPLLDLDTAVGSEPHQLTSTHAWLRHLAVGIEHAFGTWPMTGLTVVAGVALALRGHRRAAIYAVAVMAVTALITHFAKLFIARERPEWDAPLSTLTSYSFPSGHSSSVAAAAMVAAVIASMFVRKRGLRRLAIAIAAFVALVVGADRIFIGVHNLSDVVAGWSLGIAVALAALLLFDPTPKPLALKAEPMPEAVPVPERVLGVVLNPIKIEGQQGFRAMVENLARASGFDRVLWWETTIEDTGYAMAHEAAVNGAHLVLAIGGDGTIRAVCDELAGTGVPVGIVPAGTGNLLARNLGIPLYLRSAVDAALNGQDRAIDMVDVSGDNMPDSNFLVMAGMGFDAAIMEGVNEQIKAKLGWLAYVWSGLKSLLFPAITVDVSVDGAEFTTHRARTVVIGNVGTLQAGMPLLPDADIDDGLIDVVLLNPRRFLSWLPLAARVLTRNKKTDETITRMRGREVVVRARTEAPRQLDGDLIAPGKELRAACVHGRLLVRVPR